MARISANKRFTTEEFDAEQRGWIGRLIQPLNVFIEQVLQAVNQGLTIRDNFKSQTYTVSIQPNQLYPIKQAYSLNEKPTEVRLGQLRESTGAVPAAAPYVHWQYIGGNVEITMVGLDSSKSYSLTIIAQV